MPTSTRTRHPQNRTIWVICNNRQICVGAGDVTFFTIRYGKFVVAQRADRIVRPYKTVCVFADGLCNFAIAYRRVDVGIDPYRHFSYSPSVVQICPCVLHGRGESLPYITTNILLLTWPRPPCAA